MIAAVQESFIAIALLAVLQLAVMARILLRPNRDPASRIAWIVVVGVLPVLGMVVYLLLGEVSIGRRRVARLRLVMERQCPERIMVREPRSSAIARQATPRAAARFKA